jgi:hypothetical protein
MAKRRMPERDADLPEVPGGWEDHMIDGYRLSLTRGAAADESNVWVELQRARNRNASKTLPMTPETRRRKAETDLLAECNPPDTFVGGVRVP